MNATRAELLALVRMLGTAERSNRLRLDQALYLAYGAGISSHRLGKAIGRSHTTVLDRIARHKRGAGANDVL